MVVGSIAIDRSLDPLERQSIGDYNSEGVPFWWQCSCQTIYVYLLFLNAAVGPFIKSLWIN